MKKVISGSLYDTSTARLVGAWDNGVYGNDFSAVSEELYRTRSGKYFVHGEGGPLTTYAVHHGNDTSGSEEIRPMTVDQARAWAEEKLSADKYAAEFGEPEEAEDDGKRVPFPVQLKPAAIELLRRKKAEMKLTYGELVEMALDEFYGV